MVKTFATYETGMTNIAKTTGMAGAEMASFQKDFDKLAASMAVPIQSLLEIGAAAGQFGVRGAKDINTFIETMGKLQTATDIAGEEGAKSIARLLKLTGEGVGQMKTFGSVLVGLGNTTAATESEILTMASALAQSTAQYKIASTDARRPRRSGCRARLPARTVRHRRRSAPSAASARPHAQGTEGMAKLSQATGMSQDAVRGADQGQPDGSVLQVPRTC